ncbi:hypothetical protein [Amycolatopsis sp. NBC_01480]|uniref:hypothetical protein n=1 Tax=Amycolatopsis sp. NBC_01480 TaxID=2903562 RepID=UPI002E28F6AF|nr:hypothetical protein [Amycolatopsis sp. NBC_01480]
MFEALEPEQHLGDGGIFRLRWPDVAVVVIGISFTMFLIVRGVAPFTAICQATLALTSFVAVVFVGRGLRNLTQGSGFLKNVSGVGALEPQIAAMIKALQQEARVMQRLSDGFGGRWPDYPPGDAPSSGRNDGTERL